MLQYKLITYVYIMYTSHLQGIKVYEKFDFFRIRYIPSDFAHMHFSVNTL